MNFWSLRYPPHRSRADDLRERRIPPDPKPHVHFHEHDGSQHAHSHQHDERLEYHAHSHLTEQKK